MELSDIVSVYVQVIREALPFTLVFFFGDMIVTTFLSSAFGGRFTFKVM